MLGHPQSNLPARGRVKKLRRRGDVLFAGIEPAHSKFAEWVNSKMFNSVSNSFKDINTGKLRHVGFPGETPPAVKGLPKQVFAFDGEYEEFEDADLEDDDLKTTLIPQSGAGFSGRKA